MPVYEYECGKCGRAEDAYRSIDERHDAPKCHGPMKLVIGRAMGFVQQTFDPYVSPATGEVITSHAARKNDFAKSRSRPWEGKEQEQKEAARHRAYAEAKSDAKLHETAMRAFHQMAPEKRRVLEGR